MKNSEFCIPVSALALPGQSGDIAPAQGDEVDITGTATVNRIEGGKAYVQMQTVNGEAVEAAADAKEPGLEDEEMGLRADAKASDKSATLY